MDPKSLAQLARKRRIWAAALTLITLCAQVATAIMATAPSDTKAQWNEEETTALVDFLLQHKSEIGDAGMYKMGTFNAAAGHIAAHHTLGPTKTGKMCKTKWRALKIIYSSIQKYQETSGFHWDNTTGATIGTPAEENVWSEYAKIKSNAPIRPFRKKGWDLLPKLEMILPVSGAKGRHVFVASSTTGLPSELFTNLNEVGTSDEGDYEAAGSTKIGDGKVDSGDGKINGSDGKVGSKKTYPAPRKITASEVDAIRMKKDTAQTPTLSVSSGKRKYSALRNDTSGISLLSSEPTATSDVTTSEPAGKKQSIGKGKQPRKISAKKAAEISNATVLHGMQGTMNRVTEIFEKSVMQPLDPQSAVRSDALHFLQTREDDLSLDERTKVVRLFMKDNVAAETYVALVNDDLRRNWLAIMLEET